MAYRIKSRWHHSRRNNPSKVSLEDNGSALAYITWRLALEGAKKLHGEGFDYLSDRQRIGVINEFIAFLVQSIDRLAYDLFEDRDREILINRVAHGLADQMQDNLEEIAGPGSYREPFIEALNQRMADYAEMKFRNAEPGYDFIRYFGDGVLQIMGDDQTNRWVINQIMEIDAPEVFDKLRDSMNSLFGSQDAD